MTYTFIISHNQSPIGTIAWSVGHQPHIVEQQHEDLAHILKQAAQEQLTLDTCVIDHDDVIRVAQSLTSNDPEYHRALHAWLVDQGYTVEMYDELETQIIGLLPTLKEKDLATKLKQRLMHMSQNEKQEVLDNLQAYNA